MWERGFRTLRVRLRLGSEEQNDAERLLPAFPRRAWERAKIKLRIEPANAGCRYIEADHDQDRGPSRPGVFEHGFASHRGAEPRSRIDQRTPAVGIEIHRDAPEREKRQNPRATGERKASAKSLASLNSWPQQDLRCLGAIGWG